MIRGYSGCSSPARDEHQRTAAIARGTDQRAAISIRPAAIELPVTLRYGFPDDAEPIARLAALDSAEVPAHPVLLAEVGGELRAALSLADDSGVADPFHSTAMLIDLLRARAGQLRSGAEGNRRASGRWRARLGLRSLTLSARR